MEGCIMLIMWRSEQHGNSLNHCPQAGNVELTRWGVSILWIISHEPPLGSAPQWRLSETTSSGNTSAVSCRVPCSSLTRGLYLGYKTRPARPLRIRSLTLLDLCHMDGKKEQTLMAEFILYITLHGQRSGRTHELRGC